jgi:L-ascorbate metabolism protein UlaG (beta-lactamase superfamily)
VHITQLRNATILVRIGVYTILVDPMLAPKDMLPPLRVLDGLRRNPTVELPVGTAELLDTVTHCLITHCQKGHFDHLDRPGKRWLRERQIPVICTPHDASYLRKRGLNVQELDANHRDGVPFLGGTIRTLRCIHGRGLVGRLMEHGVGYLIELPGEPSLFLAGDTVMNSDLREFVAQYQPDVSVLPAGGARFDIGGEILMNPAEVVEFARIAHGMVVANHLEALSHCPVTRGEMSEAARHAGLLARLTIPRDGETVLCA